MYHEFVTEILDQFNGAKPVLFTHTIEVVTSAGEQFYNLPDPDFLRDKAIVGIVMRPYHADRKSRTGRSFVSDEVMKKSFLTLKVDSRSIFDEYPLEYIVKPDNADPGDYVSIRILKGLDPTASNIRISEGANILDNKVFEITFLYLSNAPHVKCS